MPPRNRIADMVPEITRWRQHLHRHPELGYDLPKTARFVAEKLRGFGVDEVVEGVGRSGVVAVIHGKAPGRTVALRADMDALPITEATGLDYASQTPGLMHACGHDGHSAILLGAGQYLAETRNFAGTVVLVFQPAEEHGAGAAAMIEDGLLTRWGIDEIYGLHTEPGLPVGAIATRAGPVQAASDEFDITVTGRGGHAAIPQETIDTTLVAAQIVVSLHSIVGRNFNPLHSVVLTIGSFVTDSSASNVIAHNVLLRGTLRCLDQEDRALGEARIRRVVTDTASAFGATAHIDWMSGYPVTINDAVATEHALRAAQRAVVEVTDTFEPTMTSEDFSYYLQHRPGAYVYLGNGDSAGLHNPEYVFNDDAIPYGASYFVELVEQRLAV